MTNDITSNRVRTKAAWISAVGILMVGLLGSQSAVFAQGNAFANPAFQNVWHRTDAPVAEGKVARTWVWGPTPGKSFQEAFKEGPNGQHLVQYFDKARMEINNPNGNPADPFYVTNGLLVVEMISGKVQTGVNTFEVRSPSDIRVAGDDGSDAPTYSALQNVASVGIEGKPNRAEPVAAGTLIPQLYINKTGAVSTMAGIQAHPGDQERGVHWRNRAQHRGCVHELLQLDRTCIREWSDRQCADCRLGVNVRFSNYRAVLDDNSCVRAGSPYTRAGIPAPNTDLLTRQRRWVEGGNGQCRGTVLFVAL